MDAAVVDSEAEKGAAEGEVAEEEPAESGEEEVIEVAASLLVLASCRSMRAAVDSSVGEDCAGSDGTIEAEGMRSWCSGMFFIWA